MSKEPKEKNLYQKLLEIQKHVVGLGKDKKAYGYDYVTGTKVLEHIKPRMNELGIILKQEIVSIENIRQDYQVKNGPKSEILSKVMMRFTWIDCATGEKDENLFGANGQNDWDKGVGSALTYGERYFILKYFHIATDQDDIDNPDRKPEQSSPPNKTQVPPKESKPASVKAKGALTILLNSKVIEPKQQAAVFTAMNTMDEDKVQQYIDYYTAFPDKEAVTK